jgi:type VI secretion system protein ImpA
MAGAAASTPAITVVATGEVRTRDDVIQAIDRICEYYEKFEPSSPLPLLLGRARRLVTASFMQIIQDLTPDAIQQAEQIGGGRSSG